MSVINQVLNQLEQRGAHTAAEQTMVRAVPHRKRNITIPLLLFGLALMVGIAAWQWAQARRPNVAAASIAPKSPQVVSYPEGAGNSPSFNELEKLTSQQQHVETGTPVSSVSAASLPASRLSFELSSVPLPSTLRPDSEHILRQDSGLTLTEEISISKNSALSLKPAKATAKPQPIKTATLESKLAVQTSNGALPMKQVSSAQQADAEFRKAAALMQQGRIADALAGYEAALRLDAGHDAARQALVALLLEGKRGADAERILQERLNSKPDHTGFTMMLARLQVERGAVAEATETLEKALPYANSQADYHAFLAALLQRQNRNEEAIAHYQTALQLAPNNGIWLMGYGISLQALQRNADAKDAFKHALDTQSLSPDLQAFVQQKIKGL
jgi:MSHA biogenesis protein MshN